MSTLLERITINPRQCGGRPCIRGMRIRVSDVLDLFAAGLSAEDILEEMPDLEADDLKASLLYASRKLNHPVEDLLLPTISVNSLEEFEQPIKSNLTNKNVDMMVDTQVLSYRFKNVEKDIYSQDFAISSITANEFLEVQSKNSEKPNYYVLHPARYPCSDRDHFKNPKYASRGHHRTDKIIIDFGNQFSAYREFGNEAISEIINKNQSKIYKLSILHFPKQKQKKLLKRLNYILSNGY
ncbi:conserved hypothetical protein [Planktothrix serta PCC 8927]|uniref:DUF433 domain-containing protein n=1 Tax=Planktothrix serta PCC 8927 TaxID=671068 RepID=A0A7Z9E3R6_9CYAN|nr:conserved hypothetical protein [Planktothrix serta PCC 8927]